MFMVKAKDPLAAPPSHDRSRQDAHARTGQLNKMPPFYRKNVNGAGANEYGPSASPPLAGQ